MKYFALIFVVFIFSCVSRSTKNENDSASLDTTSVNNVDQMFCAEQVKAILRSSGRYKQLIQGLEEAVKKNGGTSVDVVLEKRANKENGKESSFDISIAENYPDRQVSFAHFVFNPADKQLFEYDIVKDSLKPVDFDTRILERSDEYCK